MASQFDTMAAKADILALLRVPQDLTLRFFAVFSRFEYALKRAGYVDKSVASRVTADWESFARDVVSTLEPSRVSRLLASCGYLQSHPPKKQVWKNDRLQWVGRGLNAGSALGEALRSVRTVRNNVFHGGKFPEGPIEEPLRDEQLVRDCLVVLEGLLALPLPRDVSKYFEPEE